MAQFPSPSQSVSRFSGPIFPPSTAMDNQELTSTTLLWPGRRKSKIRKSFVEDLSVSYSPEELARLVDPSETAMTSVFAVDDLPRNLHFEFQGICESFSSSFNVFDAVQAFTDKCEAVIESSIKIAAARRNDDMSWLVNEKNTWKLIYALYRDRAFAEDDYPEPEGEPHPLSEKEIVMHFYHRNRSAREAQLVIDWLERNAKDQWNLMSNEEVGFFTDKTVAWENTLLQLENGDLPYSSSRRIVNSLDPDAPRREGLPLHDLDAEDDKRLLRQVFAEIRKGNIDKAQEICIHCGQAWRAATLEGWRLFHDPNYLSTEGKSKLPTEGNPNRGIWKLCAWKMCEDPATLDEDKAVIGALCGHLPSVLPFCSSWEDLLWANTKAAVDVAVEQIIRDDSLKEYAPLPPHYWNYGRKMEEILRDVGSSPEGKIPIRVIQELLIVDNTSELLTKCNSWIEGPCQPQFLRFLAHVVLVLRMIGSLEPEHLGDEVIKAYIKALFEEGDSDLIAFYCSKLPIEDQIEVYSEYLGLVNDSPERENCLRSAEKYELEVPRITERVVRKVRSIETQEATTSSETAALSDQVTEDDAKKISALEWMMFYENQRAEAIWETNAVVRHFIACNKLAAARLALDKVPPNSTEVVLIQYKCTLDDGETVSRSKLPPKADSAIKEYICLKAYLDARESFAIWFHEFNNSKPTMPTDPAPKDLTLSVVHEYKVNRYREDLEKWKKSMLHQTERLQTQFNNIIVFPGGWLVDNVIDEEPRKSHLERLRSLCIPEICLLLYRVLENMEMHEKVLDLLTLLMDESTGYYKVFSRQDLNNLLTKATATCRHLLKNEGTPFGKRDASEMLEERFALKLRNDDDDTDETPGWLPGRENFTVKLDQLQMEPADMELADLLPIESSSQYDVPDDDDDDGFEMAADSKSPGFEVKQSADVFRRIDPDSVDKY
ncbi:unnamed protein product [Nesidiocoris tenuis]|uniref:Nuclear pore complex protein n=1 Tax=Nesidiocoris tenuis TaxID=355587 RepID=A0A6H5GZ04_9HEMI|nr:unnamed protein product [Nesidiocoris tenuis]